MLVKSDPLTTCTRTCMIEGPCCVSFAIVQPDAISGQPGGGVASVSCDRCGGTARA